MKAVAGRLLMVVMLSTLMAALLGLVPVLLERDVNRFGSGEDLAVFKSRGFDQLTAGNLADFLANHRTSLQLTRADLRGDSLELEADAGAMSEQAIYGEAWRLIRYCLTSGTHLRKVRLRLTVGNGSDVRIDADRARLVDDPGMNNPMGLSPAEYLKEVFDVVTEPRSGIKALRYV
jgi:hypothetical protein